VKALALLEAPDHVCGRYRVSAHAPALAASGWSVVVEGIASAPLARLRQLHRASRFDAVILQRKLLPGWQLGILRASSRRLIFDFDDAILYRDSYDPRGPTSRRRASRFGRTVRAADLVLAGNNFLARCAAEHGASNVRIQPTCIATDAYIPRRDPPKGATTRLVWIGSSSTLQGLEARRSLLERLGREVPNLTLRLICDRFPAFEPLGVEAVRWTGASEADDLAGGDLGVSFLPDDLWSRGKCGLKVLQYFAAGLPVVADPVGVHPEMIAPGVHGFLPRTDDEWVAAIRLLAADREARLRMGRAARARVEAGYSVDAWSARFVAAIEGRSQPPAWHVHQASKGVRS
jgi:glycosyltransferase involved in cell wall biosynthesis